MKKLLLLVLFLFTSNIFSQTLVGNYEFPPYASYNGFWGTALKNDTLWVGSDYDNLPSIPNKIYKMTKTGVILDSLVTPKGFNHGMAWDGSGFWIAEDFRSAGARIYKINMAGVIVDSIYTGTYAGGIGGLALEGSNKLWFTVYSPESTTYPFAWAYAINTTTKLKVDSIPLRCKQAQGIAIKGDTILYVNDNFNSETERIFAYSRTVGDTVFSFPGPDPDGDDDPKGMVWDGQHLYLIAKRIGGTAFVYSALYKYSLTGGGNPIITAPNLIDFGNTIIGTSNPQTLTIQNTGTATLRLTSFTSSNPRYTIANTPDSILAGQQKNYTVTFTPTVYDTTSAILSIASNDGGTPVKQIQLKGKGVFNGANISVGPTSYGFGIKRIGSRSGYLFNIKNTGSQPLNITSMTFGGARFRLDTVEVTFPFVIDTQKTRQMRIWFNPIAASSYADSITINSNAVNNPTQRITFTGSGANSTATIGEILWEGLVPDNPFTSSDNFKPVSIKQIRDMNADGVNDMLVASTNYLITCYNGSSSGQADVLWTFNTGYNNNNTGAVGYEQGMQVRSDVNGDGIQDVVIGLGGGNEEVYTISGRTGKKLWEFGDSVTFSDGDVNCLRADKDFSGDGIPDVLFNANGTGSSPPGRKTIYILNGVTGAQIFSMPLPNTFSYDIVTTSAGFAVGLGESGNTYSIQGFSNTGSLLWNYFSPDVIWGMTTIMDINSNGSKDVAFFAGFSGSTGVIDGTTGTTIYTNSFGSSINGTIKYLPDTTFSGPFLGTQSYSTYYGPKQISRINTRTGVPLWNNGLDGSYVCGSDIVGPMGGGPGGVSIGIACGTLNNNFYMLNGFTGAIQFQYSFGNGNTDFAVEKVGRLDNINRQESSAWGSNGFEVVAGSRDGRIKCFSGGNVIEGGINTVSNLIPDKYSLEQNYPNPFNPQTKIKFALPKDEFVKVTIFDITGKEIAQLVNEKLEAGTYETDFNASVFSSGTYFYRIEAGNFIETKKMTLIK